MYPLILLVVCAAFAVADLVEADNALDDTAVDDFFTIDTDAVDDTAAAAYATDRQAWYMLGGMDLLHWCIGNEQSMIGHWNTFSHYMAIWFCYSKILFYNSKFQIAQVFSSKLR